MTAQQLYDTALSLLAVKADEATEYAPHAVAIINTLLAQTAGINNALRQQRCLPPLNELPRIAALTQTLPCEAELCAAALPYGLCAAILPNEQDMQRAVYYHNLFVSALDDLKRCEAGQVVDVYGGGDAQ